MSYSDPANPLPDPGSNPPRYQMPHDSMDTGMMIGAVVAVVFVVGIIFYAMSIPSNNTVSNPPPTTTGQGGRPVDLNPPLPPTRTPKTPDPSPSPNP